MSLARSFKKKLYFQVASYFAFWARFVLRRWNPTIVTVIGSTGKTTLLHMLQAQIDGLATYSFKANSAFGIPFHILGLERKKFSFFEWPLFIILAPFKSLRRPPQQKIYITEADAERPGEGAFLAKLLKPDYVIWLSLDEAHGANYDRLIGDGGDHKQAVMSEMAKEFGSFLEVAKQAVILNKENDLIRRESRRAKVETIWIGQADAGKPYISRNSVLFEKESSVSLPRLVPLEVSLSIVAVQKILEKLDLPFDTTFEKFMLPPGRSSVFAGIKNTTLIDSTYNATIGGVEAMLDLFKHYPATGEKWLVLGDMIEQGKSEAAEHTLLASLIEKVHPNRIILVGPRLKKYTFPLLSSYGQNVVSYMMPGEALQYLNKELKGGETILFKGARFLEGIVEKLLSDPADIDKLCRREKIWKKRRAKWGI